MSNIFRRDLLRTTGLMVAASGARAFPSMPAAEEPRGARTSEDSKARAFRKGE